MAAFSEKIETLSQKKYYILSVFAFILITIIFRSPTLFFDFFSNDEAAHITGSFVIMDKGVLYRDFVDNKPPMIYLFYIIAQFIFGKGILAVHILTNIFIIPFTSLFILIAISRKSRVVGLIGGIFYIVFSTTYIPTDMLATNCELIMNLFLSSALYLLYRSGRIEYFLSGILISLATLSKQQAGISIIIPIYLFIRGYISEKRGSASVPLTLFFTGFVIPLLSVFIYFYSKGALNEFIHFNIAHNIGYSQNPITIIEVIKRIFKYLIPYLLILSPLIYFYLKTRRDTEKRLLSIYEVALILYIIPIFVGFRFFPHYFLQPLLPLTLLSACYFIDVTNRIRALKAITAYSIVLTLAFNIYTFYFYSRKTSLIEETEPLFKRIPQTIESMDYCKHPNRERVFIWGYAPLFYYYFYTMCNMLPGSRFVLPQASIAGYIPGNESSYSPQFNPKEYINNEHRVLLMEDLKRSKPFIIIDTSPNGFHHWDRYPLQQFEELHEFVRLNYAMLMDIEGFVVYIRK